MKSFTAILALPILLSACATAPDFAGAVQQGGMSQVAVGDMIWTGCGNENEFARRFTAVDASGRPVEGVVCGGLLGPTVFAAPVGSTRLARVTPGARTSLTRIASIDAPR